MNRIVMLDLETMGVGPHAAIVQIGACDNHDDEFKCNVDLQSSIDAGGIVDGATVMWWMSQGEAARASLVPNAHALAAAVHAFSRWIGAPDPTTELWALPAAFDCVILSSACTSVGMPVPWHHRSVRCLRTLASHYPKVERVAPELTHDALSDAQAQMKWLEALRASR